MISSYLSKEFTFIFYRFRHVIIYTVIGFFSIICELVIRNYLIVLNFNLILSSIISIVIGILIAFYLNIKINFFIKRNLLFKALLYYFLISVLSITIQFLINKFTKFQLDNFYNYEIERIIISGIVFIFAYLLHKRFSFKNSAKLGVAIYGSKETDVHNIFQKIGIYPDFIHVDIVDETFIESAKPVNFSKYEQIKKYWKKQEIHTHLMAKCPNKLINQVSKFSDIIFVHKEIDENLEDIIKTTKKKNCRIGIVLHAINNYDSDLESITDNFSNIMVLCIPKAGYSGQPFVEKSYDLIQKINQIQKRKNINLFVDGGINKENIKNINAENIISGSDVLNNKDPREQIMRLKTFGRYI
jgi:ribulose-phosphate 3-epimerase|tara:strand:- start:269 stop:1339 length:1071 start_codon:yes stop_codon:yes gene_type:complete